jgi:hypothetical protein
MGLFLLYVDKYYCCKHEKCIERIWICWLVATIWKMPKLARKKLIYIKF